MGIIDKGDIWYSVKVTKSDIRYSVKATKYIIINAYRSAKFGDFDSEKGRILDYIDKQR